MSFCFWLYPDEDKGRAHWSTGKNKKAHWIAHDEPLPTRFYLFESIKSVDSVLNLRTSLELGNFLCWDVDGLLCSGVDALTCSTLRY